MLVSTRASARAGEVAEEAARAVAEAARLQATMRKDTGSSAAPASRLRAR